MALPDQDKIEQPNQAQHGPKSTKWIVLGSVGLILILFMVAIIGLRTLKNHFENLKNRSFQENSGSNSAGNNAASDVNYSWDGPTDLAACQGTEVFSVSPVVPDTYDHIEPLGHTSSFKGNAGHVFPSDHLYIAFKYSQPGNLQSATLPVNVVAPGNGEIYQITDTSYSENGKITRHDFRIYFAPCKGVEVRFDHLNNLGSVIQNAITASTKNCQNSYTTGGPNSPTYEPCDYKFDMKINAGDAIGTAGGPGVASNEFDFGVYDRRNKPLPFIIDSGLVADDQYAVCGISYYPEGSVKNTLFASLKTTKTDANGQKDCGVIMWDKVGTISGDWIMPGTPTKSAPSGGGQNAISFARYNMDPSQGNIDWGGVIASADQISFPLQLSGLINRDPVDVTADGKVYCFQGSSSFTSTDKHTLYIQLIDGHTLKVEHHAGNICPVNPTLTNPTTYNR